MQIAPETAERIARGRGLSLDELRELARETGLDLDGPRGLIEREDVEYVLQVTGC